jgi:hypothetical protein
LCHDAIRLPVSPDRNTELRQLARLLRRQPTTWRSNVIAPVADTKPSTLI